MANFGGRRAPNVSQYIANLNTIPSEFDVATQQEENYSLADDLATFTNAEFFDFDLGSGVEASVEYDPSQEARVKAENVAARKDSANGLGFVNGMLFRHSCARCAILGRICRCRHREINVLSCASLSATIAATIATHFILINTNRRLHIS